MRTVYLQRSLSLNGRDALRGRALVDRLRQAPDELLLGHMVAAQSKVAAMHADIRPDVVSEVELLRFDPQVIYLEGGLFFGRDGDWRIERTLAEEFVERGGTLIVADVDLTVLREQRELYGAAVEFLGATASYRGRDPVVGYDRRSHWQGEKQILCDPQDMVVSDWLRPIYQGIEQILVVHPVRLASFGAILASGNQSSTWSDATDGIPGPDDLAFASVAKRGAGFVVLICGSVSSDVWLEGCPHNTDWLAATAHHLSQVADRDRRRGGSAFKSAESVFLSHCWHDKPTVAAVHASLQREHYVGAWIDQQELIAGDPLPRHIEDAVRGATLFVLFWSQRAAESAWVQRELEIALSRSELGVLVVRLDESNVPEPLANTLRLECQDASAGEIAQRLVRTIEARHKRTRIARAQAGQAAAALVEPAAPPPPPLTGSLTREATAAAEAPVAARHGAGVLPAPHAVASIRSDYRIDVLSFLDAGRLVAGSGDFDRADIERAIAQGLIDGFEKVNCHTGMDGHLDDHLASRRHLLFGYHDMRIFDRAAGALPASVECDAGAEVRSAAWSPAGDRFIVASTSYLTVADAQGGIVNQRNMYTPRGAGSPNSVVWQPSRHPIYASGTSVFVAAADGTPLCELREFAATVIVVAVSPCCRFIAAAAIDGRLALWSETGQLLLSVKGFASMGRRASRSLAFSPDSRYLAQAACSGGEGIFILDLERDASVRLAARKADLLAFHPRQADLLVAAAEDQISFWRLET